MSSMGRGKAKGMVGMLIGKGIDIRMPGLPTEYAEQIVTMSSRMNFMVIDIFDDKNNYLNIHILR